MNSPGLEQVRGLALLRNPMPVVAINAKEILEAKAFSLLREVVHLMLAGSDEELPASRERRKGAEWADVERFAEVAASHALIPEEARRRVVGRSSLAPTAWTIQEVRRAANKFWVTPLATATRLRESGFMSWTDYNSWRAEWNAHVATLPPRSKGFATPVAKAISRARRPFAQLVLEALSANRITVVDASRYLELRFEHFEKLRDQLI
jgi:Zn-dependent peptidase ImmA (M78 family)